MKLLGLFKIGSTHAVHAVIEQGKTVCGRKVDTRKDRLPHSGRTNVTCQKCLRGIPGGYA
jgi:hypothetical protein